MFDKVNDIVLNCFACLFVFFTPALICTLRLSSYNLKLYSYKSLNPAKSAERHMISALTVGMLNISILLWINNRNNVDL